MAELLTNRGMKERPRTSNKDRLLHAGNMYCFTPACPFRCIERNFFDLNICDRAFCPYRRESELENRKSKRRK